MNDEIKEILDKLKDDNWYDELDLTGEMWIELRWKETHLLLDYITNLQQDNTMYAQLKDEYEEEIKDLQQENERLKEENKHIFANVNDDELLISNAMNYTEAQDYKSRCEKASEIIKKEKEIMGYAKYDSCLLLIENILQNGGDKVENI